MDVCVDVLPPPSSVWFIFFRWFAVYGYFDAYAVENESTVTIVDNLFYYFSHLGRVGYAAGCLEVCYLHGGCLFAEREQANTMWREVTF